MFTGSTVALVTPFDSNDRVDGEALKKLVDWHIEQGTNNLLPCGTTGESATFTHDEQFETIRMVVEFAAGRVPVIAGAGSNCTREAISLAQRATEAGADGILSVVPYYNKPTQDGLVAHYTAIGQATDKPVVLYNVPSRTGTNMVPATCVRIAEEIKVACVKEASGDLGQAQELIDAGLAVVSGEDGLTFPMMCMGGCGTISVVANFAPRLVADLCAASAAGDLPKARELQKAVYELTGLAFCETNPIPAKTALAALGFCDERFRLPLVPMTEVNKERLLAGLRKHGILAA